MAEGEEGLLAAIARGEASLQSSGFTQFWADDRGLPLNPDGSRMSEDQQPAFFGLGPGYNEAPSVYSGPPPITPEPGTLDYSAGNQVPQGWENYDNGNYSTGGGFFTIDKLLGEVPAAFQSGSTMPSTNNYRLLAPEYQRPNYIMRNGQIIDLNSYLNGPPSLRGENGFGPGWRSGANIGVPAAWSNGSIGWGMGGWPGSGSMAYWGASS